MNINVGHFSPFARWLSWKRLETWRTKPSTCGCSLSPWANSWVLALKNWNSSNAKSRLTSMHWRYAMFGNLKLVLISNCVFSKANRKVKCFFDSHEYRDVLLVRILYTLYFRFTKKKKKTFVCKLDHMSFIFIQKAREENKELRAEIDVLRMASQDQKKKGNSLFAEVCDIFNSIFLWSYHQFIYRRTTKIMTGQC